MTDLSDEFKEWEFEKWVDFVKENQDLNECPFLVVLGSKADIAREDTRERVKMECEVRGLPFFEVSAKEGLNVEEAVSFMIMRILDELKVERPKVVLRTNSPPVKNRCKCLP